MANQVLQAQIDKLFCGDALAMPTTGKTWDRRRETKRNKHHLYMNCVFVIKCIPKITSIRLDGRKFSREELAVEVSNGL